MPETFFKIRNAASGENRLGRFTDVSLDIYRGECLALSGHTYSGFKELYAVLCKNSPYTGQILLQDGKELRNCRSPYEAGALYIDQRIIARSDPKSLLNSLSSIYGQDKLLSLVNDSLTAARFEALLEGLGCPDCHLNLKDRFRDLSRFDKIRFAILRCLYAGAGCILLENPFQGLREEESEQLVDLLARVKKHGTALVYVSDENISRMERLIDRIAVFRHGTVCYIFYPEGLNHRFDSRKIELAAGGKTQIRKKAFMPPEANGHRILSVWKNGRALDFCSGERIGIYDPEMRIPSEYESLASYLNGFEIILDGKDVRLRGMRDFLDRSVVLIRKDPGRELFLNLSPVENVTLLSGRGASSLFSRRRIDRYIYREVCERYSYLHSCLAIMDKTSCYEVSELDLRCLVIAKWLSLNPQIVLFFDLEDTYQPGEQKQSSELIRQLSREGVLVITVSPNLDFLEKTSERIIDW